MNGLSMFPANFTDMTGSLIIIIFSFLSLRYDFIRLGNEGFTAPLAVLQPKSKNLWAPY